MKINIDTVKALRNQTGAGVWDCQKALVATEGDITKASELLLKKGLISASKLSSRKTPEGVIASYIHTGGRIGSMVELNCETDSVARLSEFTQLARDIAMQVAAMNPLYIDTDSLPKEDSENVSDYQILVKQSFIKDPSVSVGDLVNNLSSKTRENVRIGRFKRFAIGD